MKRASLGPRSVQHSGGALTSGGAPHLALDQSLRRRVGTILSAPGKRRLAAPTPSTMHMTAPSAR